jgi:hypothetical protein
MNEQELMDKMKELHIRRERVTSAAYIATNRISGMYTTDEQNAVVRELAALQIEATLLNVEATLLAAEPQPLWSPPVVGEIETTTDRGERSARVRELLGRLEGSDMTTVGDMNNLRELKRLVFDMLDNPTYPAVEIETAERAAEVAEVLRDYVEDQARMAEDRARVGGSTPAETRNLHRFYNQLESAANDVEDLARFLSKLAQAGKGKPE